MAVSIYTNSDFGVDIPTRGLPEMAEALQRAEETQADHMLYYSGNGRGSTRLEATGTNFTYTEDGIVSGGNVATFGIFHG